MNNLTVSAAVDSFMEAANQAAMRTAAGIAAGSTLGDMLYFDGANYVLRPATTNGFVLTLAGGVPVWAAGGNYDPTNVAITGGTISGVALVLGTPTSGNLTNCTTDGTNLIGYRGAPQNSQSAAYTTVLADAGKSIFHPASDNNARTFTIDSNANVAFPIGTIIEFINMAAASTTIAITVDTLTLLPTGTTGPRTLAQYGRASAEKIDATDWVISGNSALT